MWASQMQGIRRYWLFVLLATLLFVWSIGNTVALRNLLIGLILLGLLPLAKASLGYFREIKAGAPWGWFLAVTAWLVLQALFISPETNWALTNIRGQWIKAALCLFLGYGVVFWGKEKGFSRGTLCLVVAGALGVECLAHALDSLWLWWQQGVPPLSVSRVTGSKERISYVNNLFFSILAAEVVARLNGTPRLLPVSRKWVVFGLVVVYFNSWVIGARNGEIGALALTVSAAFLVLIAQRHRLGTKRLGVVLAGLLVFLSALGYLGYKSDGRWNTLWEQAQIGWQTDTYRFWLNAQKYPRPLDSEGREVSLSNYLRIAWIKEGVKIIADTPWGVGYGRTAFGHALAKRYPEDNPRLGAHSHSGIIDWTIGTGWLGLILWLGFVGVGMKQGVKKYVAWSDPAALMLLFVVTGYFSRSLVDSNIRDHMLEQFMFLYGFFYALCCWGLEAPLAVTGAKETHE